MNTRIKELIDNTDLYRYIQLEKSLPLLELEKFAHLLKDELYSTVESDAIIGRLVREKFKSGNNIPVTRITIDRNEIAEQLDQE